MKMGNQISAYASGEALRDGVTDFLKSSIGLNILGVFVLALISLLGTILFVRFGILPPYIAFAMFVGQWTAALWLVTIGLSQSRRV